MKFPTPLVIALLPALTRALPSSSTRQLECLRLRAEDLAAEANCGSAVSIAQSMRDLPDAWSVEDIERVFREAECSPDEAIQRTRDALSRCSESGDLRKREAFLPADGWGLVTALPEMTAAPEPFVHIQARATTDGSTTSTSSLKCIATRTESTTVCTQATLGVQSCKPTVALFTKCADGLICKADRDDVCMVAQTTLDTGGLIITIFFAAALTLSIALITFMCCKEQAMHKRLAAKADADDIAKEAAAASRKTRADTQPLMAAGSPSGPRAQSPASPGAFGGNSDSNPFHDGNRL